MFLFTDSRPGVALAFTDRHGGVSSGPWQSLNLGTSNGDDLDAVARNHELLASALSIAASSMEPMSQVHGDAVHVHDERSSSVPVADALVTRRPDRALLVRVADCLPVVLADQHAGVVGVAHAGREGLVRGVVAGTVAAMRAQGAESMTAWMGQRVCGRCYEVPAQLRDDVAAAVPAAESETSWGTPALDIGAGVLTQLGELGVDVIDVADVLGRSVACTLENEDLFSYRRQGRHSGRMGGLVRLLPQT